MAELRGIDVSASNGKIEWELTKEAIDFAIIRIGFGDDIKKQDDKKAEFNMDECERLGIPYGVYLYSYALSVDDARKEAQHMLRMIKGRKPEYGIWFDMEDADGYKKKHGLDVYSSGRLLTDMCKVFLDIIKDAGFTSDQVGIYASLDYFKNILDLNKLKSLGRIWLAQWSKAKSMDCAIWQYSSTGKVPGINGNVDMDTAFVSEKKVVKQSAIKKDEPEKKEEAKSTTKKHFPKYEGNSCSIVMALVSLGFKDTSYAYRVTVAHANGISNYSGKAVENLEMLAKLKEGILIMP